MTFEMKKAYRLAKWSEAAYLDESDLVASDLKADDVKQVSFDAFGENGPLGVSALVGGNDKHLVLAFRGTVFEVRDWNKLLLSCANGVIDLAFHQVAHARHGWRVHSGFAHAINQVWGEIYETVMSTKKRGQRLWVTGHSLGGALANLAASEFCHHGVDVAGVYTYGAPRVGDLAYASGCSFPLYRLENRHDLIPHLPPPPALVSVGQLFLSDLLDELERFVESGITLTAQIDRDLASRLSSFLGGFIRWIRECFQIEYRHAGRLRYFDPDGDLIDTDGASFEVPEALSWLLDEDDLRQIARLGCDLMRFVGFLGQLLEDLRNGVLSFLADHKMTSYLARVSAWR